MSEVDVHDAVTKKMEGVWHPPHSLPFRIGPGAIEML
jgi:hypothetical protein